MVLLRNGGGRNLGRREGIKKTNGIGRGKRGAQEKTVCSPDEPLLGALWAVRLGFPGQHRGALVRAESLKGWLNYSLPSASKLCTLWGGMLGP